MRPREPCWASARFQCGGECFLHGDGNESRGAHCFEEHVGQWLEDGVRHEEDRQSRIVRGNGESQIVL